MTSVICRSPATGILCESQICAKPLRQVDAGMDPAPTALSRMARGYSASGIRASGIVAVPRRKRPCTGGRSVILHLPACPNAASLVVKIAKRIEGPSKRNGKAAFHERAHTPGDLVDFDLSMAVDPLRSPW